MDTISLLAHGMVAALHWNHFLVMLGGLLFGVVAGALPGISFVNAMAMALPFTYLMAPLDSMAFLGGIYAGGVFGGSISSILINIPGTPASLPACWDGFPMTKRGESGKALTIAIAASATGGIVSALLLAFAAPPFAKFALNFDQPEFFAATFLGLVSIIAVAKSAPMVSMLSLFIGLIIGCVGVDPLYGMSRFTFGIPSLQSGINFVVVMIGLFALGEVVEMLVNTYGAKNLKGKHSMAKVKFKELAELRGSVIRGSTLGCMIGMIPGAGATVGAVIAYGVEKQVSPRGKEFGTGVPNGLAAPEAAKNATTGAAMIPLLTLGIPGSAATAIMLAALMLKGITPGPLLFTSDPDLVYAIFASLLLANLCMIIVGPMIARGFSHIMKVPPPVLSGFIVILSVLGAFGVRNNMFDVYVCMCFGVIGYIMKLYNFPAAPLVLGVILGPLAERYFLTSLANYDNNLMIFFERPISLTILMLALMFVLWVLTPSLKNNGFVRRYAGMK